MVYGSAGELRLREAARRVRDELRAIEGISRVVINGIRERASLSIKGMPEEIQTLFIDQLILGDGDRARARERRRYSLRQKLEEVADESVGTVRAGPPAGKRREGRSRESSLQPAGPPVEAEGV